MKTLSELEATSGYELDAMLARCIGADVPRVYWLFKWRSSPLLSWHEYPCLSSKEKADAIRSSLSSQGDETTEPESYEMPAILEEYCTDLNACHAVEKTLTPHQWPKYVNTLCDVTRDRNCEGLVFATGRQRTIALIFTLQQP